MGVPVTISVMLARISGYKTSARELPLICHIVNGESSQKTEPAHNVHIQYTNTNVYRTTLTFEAFISSEL